MRSLGTLLTLWLCLCGQALSNNASIGEEMLYLYYVYKMDYLTGRNTSPPSNGMGSACRHATALCTFPDFLKDAFPAASKAKLDFYKNQYLPNLPANDHTTTPNANQLVHFQQAVMAWEATGNSKNGKPPYRALLFSTDKLINAFTGQARVGVYIGGYMQKFVLDIMRTAMATGSASLDDAKNALQHLRRALDIRTLDAALYQSLIDAFEQHVGPNLLQYLVRGNNGNGWFDWKATFNNIRNAYPPNDPTAKGLLQNLKQFATTIRAVGGAAPIAIKHIDLMQAYQISVDQLNKRIGDSVSKNSNTIVPNSKMDKACLRQITR